MTTMPRETRLDAYDPSGRDDSRNWRDTGCRLHPSCLNCPRPVCVYDEKPRGPRGPGIKIDPAIDIVAMREWMTIPNIALVLGVSERTVQRELRRRGV